VSAATPPDALRLLAVLIAEDIRAGSPLLAMPCPVAEPPVRKRGRPKSIPYAVAAAPIAIAA
jgi:hypothetical protein